MSTISEAILSRVNSPPNFGALSTLCSVAVLKTNDFESTISYCVGRICPLNKIGVMFTLASMVNWTWGKTQS